MKLAIAFAALAASAAPAAAGSCLAFVASAPAGFVNVRTGPDLSAAAIDQIPNDAQEIRWCGRSAYDYRGAPWVFVTYRGDYAGETRRGWVSHRMLYLLGPTD